MTKVRHDNNEELWQTWFRTNPRLDSIREGLSIQNADIWIHQFKIHMDRVGTRKVNNLMLVEVKTFSAAPDFAQRDTLAIASQIIHTGNRYVVVKDATGLKRKVRCWGIHYLLLDGSSPEISSRIVWDNHQVDVATLEEILTFQRDPDTLQLRSERRHHISFRTFQNSLWDGYKPIRG